MSHSNTRIEGSVSSQIISSNPCGEISLGKAQFDVFSVAHWLTEVMDDNIAYYFNLDDNRCNLVIESNRSKKNIYLPYSRGSLYVILHNKKPYSVK